jgi:hypothetical protein
MLSWSREVVGRDARPMMSTSWAETFSWIPWGESRSTTSGRGRRIGPESRRYSHGSDRAEATAGTLPPSRPASIRVQPAEERVDDWALRHASTAALSGHLGQDALDRPKIRDLSTDVVEMLLGDPLHLGAGIPAAVDQGKERPDLVQGEAQLSSPADEAQTTALSVSVHPMSPCAAGGGGEQADALVVADRFDIAARLG